MRISDNRLITTTNNVVDLFAIQTFILRVGVLRALWLQWSVIFVI